MVVWEAIAMKKLSHDVYTRIRQWVYLHARFLDMARWRYHFEGGPANDVLHALSFYQNDDGGFGHGIEYDCLNPNSSPVQFFWGAAGILREIGCDAKDHPVMRRIIEYFENCPYVTETGCWYAIPSNNDYPCNPWCLYTTEPRFPGDWLPEENVNAGAVKFALTYCDEDSGLYRKALKIIDYRISLIPRLKDYLLFNQSREWQGLEPSDFTSIVQLAEKHKIKSSNECRERYGQILSIIKEWGFPETHQKIIRQIETNGAARPVDLDGIIDGLSSGRVWLEGGLRCADPVAKMRGACDLQSLWFPIKGLIGDMIVLKEHGRIS